MKITAIEAPKRSHEEQASFLVNAPEASLIVAIFWLLSEIAHLVDAASCSPQQQGGAA